MPTDTQSSEDGAPTPADAADPAPSVTGEALRQAMAGYPSGVTVLTADDGAARHAMTVSSFTSVSLEPPLILVCVSLKTRMAPILRRAGAFAVHMLAASQADIAHICAAGDLAERVALMSQKSDAAPRLKAWAARLECRLEAEHPGGDHGVFIGRVTLVETTTGVPAPDLASKPNDADGPDPLLWWRGAPRRLARSD